MIKAIPTEYKGYLFRSRFEARWAVFFDACKVKWEYEPEGYDLGDGTYYLPDFLLHDVAGRAGGDLYLEVKGRMTDEDAHKINRFVELGKKYNEIDGWDDFEYRVLVVGNIPDGEDEIDITNNIINSVGRSKPEHPAYYNFQTIDGDYFGAIPGINNDGRFEVFGEAVKYLYDMDGDATARAYRLARQARFEHGEKPLVGVSNNAITSSYGKRSSYDKRNSSHRW